MILRTISRWILVTLVFLVPVLFLPTTQEFFTTSKVYLLVFGVLTIIVLWSAAFLIDKKMLVVRSPFAKILIALLFVRGVSIVFSSTNAVQALTLLPTGMTVFGALVLMYIVAMNVGARNKMQLPVWKALLYGTGIAALISTVFYFNPFEGASLPPTLSFLQNSQFSPVGNVFDSALLYGFGVIGIAAYIYSVVRSRTPNRLIPKAVIGVIIAIALGISIVHIVQTPEGQAGFRLPPTQESWVAAVETLKTPRTALIGVGPGNYEALFTQIKTPAYNTNEFWNVNYALSRSALLHIWVESGLLGLITMLMIGVYAIREVVGLYQRHDKRRDFYAALGLYLALVLLLFPPTFISFFLLFVYLIGLSLSSMQHEPDAIRELDGREMFPAVLGTTVVMIALAASGFYFAGRAYAAEMAYKDSIDAIQQNNGQAVYNNLRKAINLNPYNERFRSQFSQVNLLLANSIAQQEDLTDQQRQSIAQFIQQAISEGKTLAALNPAKASSWNNLAVIYRNVINVAEGADAWTVASYREAIRRDPNNPQLRLNLGGVYYAAENYELAQQQFLQAIQLKPDWANAHYNLAWALYQGGDPQNAVLIMQNVISLVDEGSENYQTAVDNLETFRADIPEQPAGEETPDSEAAEASQEAVETVPEDSIDENPLSLPTPPKVEISPPIELPEDSGPDTNGQEDENGGTDGTGSGNGEDGGSAGETSGDETSPTPTN